jgi:hypothetical protein
VRRERRHLRGPEAAARHGSIGHSAATLSLWQRRVGRSTSNATRGSSLSRAEARDADRPDDEIIEDVLSRYLLERLLDKTQGAGRLTEEEATRQAVDELHAMRRERGGAA